MENSKRAVVISPYPLSEEGSTYADLLETLGFARVEFRDTQSIAEMYTRFEWEKFSLLILIGAIGDADDFMEKLLGACPDLRILRQIGGWWDQLLYLKLRFGRDTAGRFRWVPRMALPSALLATLRDWGPQPARKRR